MAANACGGKRIKKKSWILNNYCRWIKKGKNFYLLSMFKSSFEYCILLKARVTQQLVARHSTLSRSKCPLADVPPFACTAFKVYFRNLSSSYRNHRHNWKGLACINLSASNSKHLSEGGNVFSVWNYKMYIQIKSFLF